MVIHVKKKPDTKSTLSDSMYMKTENRQNKAMVIGIRWVEEGDWLNGDMGKLLE